MDEPRDWPAVLSPPQRNNFFFGKMMGVAQFEREQRYGMGQRWLINRLTIGTGVLCGLEVTLTADGKRLRVAPGVAVDPWGREIVVAQSRDYDPFTAGGGCGCGDGAPIAEAKDYMFCLTYCECTTNDQPVQYDAACTGMHACQPDTTVESYRLGLSAVEAPKPFDCAKWTAAVATGGPGRRPDVVGEPGGVAPPARPPIGDITLTPAEPAAAPVSSPPSIELLRARLAEQLGSSCGAPATTCVPLALVTAKRVDDKWVLAVAEGPRRRIYTQAQMLEMILCLAGCCGGGHPTTEPPPATFQVTGVDLGTVRVVDGVLTLDAVTPTTNGGIRTFAFPASDDAGEGDEEVRLRGPIVIRVTFNGRLDKDSVALPNAAQARRSVLLTVTDKTNPAKPIEVIAPIPIAVVPDSLTADSSTLLLLLVGGEAGVEVTRNVSPFGTTATAAAVKPGDYTLTLYGDEQAAGPGVAEQIAISSIASTAPALHLDGNFTGTFPSGDRTPGGNFVFPFVLSKLP